MANELNIDFGTTGLTVTATLIQANAVVGTPVALSESGTVTGFYSGDMPAVSSGVYSIRFSGGTGYTGSGTIDWDGSAERRILSLPTNTQLEARTLPTADYFDPATDTVATVTSLTNAVTLPSIPADWITAAGIAADAVTEIQSGLSTVTLAEVQAAGFTTERNTALLDAQAAALAIADGRHVINYTASTATQYNADGTLRTVFDLKDAAGNPATATSAAVERVPQP